MPDPSPPAAAAEFLRLNANNLRKPSKKSRYQHDDGKVVNILALGLSFMGQPVMSLGCLYKDMVVDGFVWKGSNSFGSINEIRQNGSICSGYLASNIKDMFPSNMNPNRVAPKQNVHECSADHSLVEYVDPKDPSLPKVRVCYRYTFNVLSNWRPLKQGGKKPCGWDWTDVDVAIGFISASDLVDVMLPRYDTTPSELSHLKVININNIYAGLISQKLNIAVDKANKQVVDIRAKPRSCTKPDIHYRLPGVPDIAIQVFILVCFLFDNSFFTLFFVAVVFGDCYRSSHI